MLTIRIILLYCATLITSSAGETNDTTEKPISETEKLGNLTEFHLCKLSHFGLEYSGSVAKSESGARCQSWTKDYPHKVDENISDGDFPENSKEKARSYCRNPGKDPDGPWCYTMNEDLINETCGIPLCSFSKCRLSGPGMEYAGDIHKSVSDRKCLKWNKDRSRVRDGDGFIKIDRYKGHRFPEGSSSDAKKNCRNPDGDVGGPWCFIENEETDYIEKQYCDVPFCDEADCVVFTKNYSTYMHYTDFNNTLENLTFGIKLWDSDLYLQAEARLVLTVLPLPLDGKDIERLGIGIEIFISNKGSALTVSNKDTEIYYEESKNSLRSTEYTYFDISWRKGFITLTKVGKIKPIFIGEYRTKDNLMGFKMNEFNYYAAQGSNLLWTFPFCTDDYECDVHTTTGEQFQQFWPMHETTIGGHEVIFYLRAFRSARVLLVPSPTVMYPQILLELQGITKMTKVYRQDFKAAPQVLIEEMELKNLLSYWNFQEFTVSLFSDTFQLYRTKTVGTHMIMDLRHDIFSKMRWFSVSSFNSVAHWTFFCLPPPPAKPPIALLPECALNEEETDYGGTQNVISEGLPCLPWSGKELIPSEVAEQFENTNNLLNTRNYCRDPAMDKKGTYCYVIDMHPKKEIRKEYCKVRSCKSQECKVAGTGNDYSGRIHITRSKRNCEPWASNPISIQVHNSITENGTLFPDPNITAVKNYCRNPTREILGPWCYTTDPRVVMDTCMIQDCDKPEQCTVIITKESTGRKVYILPQWKESGIHGGLHFSVKNWNPDLTSTLKIQIEGHESRNRPIILNIGSDNNQRVDLIYEDEVVKQKTLPHTISSGIWTEYWLQIRREEILLGFEGVPAALFEWKHPDGNKTYEPIFISFSTFGGPIGLSFRCDECQTENVTEYSLAKIWPLTIWSRPSDENNANNINLTVRGKGRFSLSLTAVPGSIDGYALRFDTETNRIELFKEKVNDSKLILLKEEIYQGENLVKSDKWVTLRIFFSEESLKVEFNDAEIFTYRSSDSLVFYAFCISAIEGWISWTANCEPVDLDGPPRDGGWSAWSPWQCSAPCGGGEGFRTRTCSNPRPNIKGKQCKGSHMATGKCNVFQCGDVSPTTLNHIREKLQKEQNGFMIDEGTDITLRNDEALLRIIDKESPDSYYEWTLNGLFIKPIQNHVIFTDDDLLIRNASVKDAGIYICILYRINKKRVIFRVQTLAVKTKDFEVITRATRPLSLRCNAVVLAYVYSDLSLKWIINETIYKDYGTTTLAAVNVEEIPSLDVTHTGSWQCVVEQKDLGLKWVTNYVRVLVKKKPNIYTNLMEDELTAPLFVQKKEGSKGITTVYRSMWKVEKSKKIEVAMKMLKPEYSDKHLKDFLDLASRWAFIRSSAIVRLYGITLRNVSMVLEYFRLGPLDQYLRDNKHQIKAVDLIEASSNLASALWHLEENGIVHGNIRCRKIMVNTHDENSFTVKLTDPGIHTSYASKEVHWIPVECYSNLDFAKKSTAADVWAFATTLWEIFMLGEEISPVDHEEAMRWYASGKILPKPPLCPQDIYNLMKECWNLDPHRRKQPQAVMRDISQILYQVYNSRRTHSYAKVFSKVPNGLQRSHGSLSTNSLLSSRTESTFVQQSDDLMNMDDATSVTSETSSFSGRPSQRWILNSQDLTNCEDTISCDFSNILSNFNFSTTTTSLDSISSMQSIFELDADCNVVLQGRIGQGFYGEVYRGTLEYLGDDEREPRQVAIKKLKSSAMSSGLQDFEREINIMKTLKHPNIVEILGVLREPEILLVMEFVHHGSLQSYLKINKDSLDINQLLKYANDIAKGMDYLSQQKIVHRDLAARNILVVDKDHVKISDFGLAQVIGAEEYYVLKTNRELPIKWYAPESLRHGKFSVRSDVWSYGVTMCEMFNYGEEPTLTIPEQDKIVGQEQQVLMNALESGARFPCPPMCTQVIYIRLIIPCWENDPHNRPTFSDLISETQNLLSHYTHY